MKLILVLSGRIASGKSTLCQGLVNQFGFELIKTNEILRSLAEGRVEFERKALQQYGASLDRKTRGAWVVAGLKNIIEERELSDDAEVVIDAVRIENQIEALRAAYSHRVVHIHVTAPDDVLEARFRSRYKKGFIEATSFAETQKNPTERRVKNLAKVADVVIDTKLCSSRDVLVRVASRLGLYGRSYERLVDVMVGGQYGSEGKGHIASYLAKEYDILVRVGGPNAGHTVYHPPYTFHHLPSGSANLQSKLIVGPGAVLNLKTPKGKTKPKGLLAEIMECEISAERLSIDPQAMIIELEDITNESALETNIASTATGVGYATARRILGREDYNSDVSELVRLPRRKGSRIQSTRVRLAKNIKELRPYIRSTYEELENAFSRGKRVFLEGTQGTALSIYHGHYPHVTSRDTTVAGCLAEAGIAPNRVRKVIMVCRTYPIRVGNAPVTGNSSGFMSQEISFAEIAQRSGLPLTELVRTEVTSTTKRQRRVAEFDWSLLRKSASLNAPTDIALSFVDYISSKNKDARRFEQLTNETIRFIEEVEQAAAAPVSLISTRFHARSIIDRRTWKS